MSSTFFSVQKYARCCFLYASLGGVFFGLGIPSVAIAQEASVEQRLIQRAAALLENPDFIKKTLETFINRWQTFPIANVGVNQNALYERAIYTAVDESMAGASDAAKQDIVVRAESLVQEAKRKGSELRNTLGKLLKKGIENYRAWRAAWLKKQPAVRH